MNKSDLKNFAINARLALLQRVADRAALYGIDEEKCQSRAIVPSSSFHMLDGSVLSAQEVGQRNALIARISKIGYHQTMEEAAYTWFNRLIAIRYMQQHSLLPVSMRVLPEAPGALPQILREAQDVSLPGVEPDQVLAMLDANRTDALYRYLLIALCNALGGWLPGMFQQITSVAELLFPAALLKADSVLGEMARLDDDCWNEIQVIGWLYQYYISQRHDEVVDINGSAIKKEDIPAATCLYTTDWVVRYMVENSLGRLWLEGHPNETLRMKWRYYMDEAPQEPAVAARLAQLRAPYAALQPDQLTVLEKTLSTLIQTNDTYESTQIDAFFESKPKIDAFLKIDANAQKVGIQNGILTPDVLETGCRFYVCGIFLVCFLYCVLRTSEKRAVSSFPLSCMPRLIHSSIHP